MSKLLTWNMLVILKSTMHQGLYSRTRHPWDRRNVPISELSCYNVHKQCVWDSEMCPVIEASSLLSVPNDGHHSITPTMNKSGTAILGHCRQRPVLGASTHWPGTLLTISALSPTWATLLALCVLVTLQKVWHTIYCRLIHAWPCSKYW